MQNHEAHHISPNAAVTSITIKKGKLVPSHGTNLYQDLEGAKSLVYLKQKPRNENIPVF